MDIRNFLEHHGIADNPYGAEEARHDPVFERLALRDGRSHPEMVKILGNVGRPQSSVVFGEKGSGKTALRLMMGRAIVKHNEEHPESRTLIVAYDDFNPVLDLVTRKRRSAFALRLGDHQDAILGLATTRLVDALHGEGRGAERMLLPPHASDRLERLPRRQRVDLAVLAALYDSPRGGGDVVGRWRALRRRLRLGWRLPFPLTRALAMLFTVLAIGFLVAPSVKDLLDLESAHVPAWSLTAAGISAAVALLLWIAWLLRWLRLWNLCRRIARAAPALDRTPAQLRQMLGDLAPADRAYQPWPRAGGDATNARYELTHKLLEVLAAFDHRGIVVLVDRVDEPTLVAGRPERMRAIVWPMLDSKFLQQDRVGIKLLLPLELRYLVQKEDAEFFEEARLDKQNLVDHLAWSGATLYDLCSDRLRACHGGGGEAPALTDLFADDVGREMLVEALGQMRQPRDAFKLLYAVIREHCHSVPEEEATYRIARHTLETVRREQAERILERRQGLSPA